MLAKRLSRRGAALSGSAVALAVSQKMASAAVPPSLVSSTVKIGSLVLAGKISAAVAISAKVIALTEGVVKGMLLTKLKTIAATLVVVGVVGLGARSFSASTGAGNQAGSQKPGGPKDSQVQAVQEKATSKKNETHEAQDEAEKQKITMTDFFQVQKVDFNKRTIRGAIGSTNLEQTTMSFNGDWELSIEPTTKIVIDGKPAQLEGLQILKGAAITNVEYEFALSQHKKRLAGRLELGKGKAISIEAMAPRFIAYVQKIDSSKDSVVVKKVRIDPFSDTFTSWPLVQELPEDEKTDVFKLNPDVSVILDKKPARPADLKPKMLVMLQMSAVEDRVFRITAFGPAVMVVLKTIDTNANTISARIPLLNVTAQNILVAKDAKVVINGREGKLSDLKAGMRVCLQMSAEADDSYIIGITVGNEPEEIDHLRFLPHPPA